MFADVPLRESLMAPGSTLLISLPSIATSVSVPAFRGRMIDSLSAFT
jgi:hypothetical protein